MTQLPSMFIDIGFGKTFSTRAPVDRLIKTVRKSMTDGTKLKFTSNQLKNFTHVFLGDDFVPIVSGESDLRLKVFSVLRSLKVNNYAEFNSEIIERVKKFIKENRESFSEDVGEIDKFLIDDPRDELLIHSLIVSSQERIDFLYGVGLFDPAQVKFEDLQEVLSLKNSKNVLADLETRREKFNEKIGKMRENGIFDEKFTLAVNQLSALQKVINYNITIEDSKSHLKIQDFLMKYSEATNSRNYKHDEKTIEALLFYTNNNSKLDEPEALAILSILHWSQNDNFLDIPKNILNAIEHNEHHMKIIKFGSEKNLKNPKNFCEFMMKIFVVNDDKKIYRTVLVACRKYENHLGVQQQFIVDVEEEILDLFAYSDIHKNMTLDRSMGLIEVIQELIEAKQMVTQNMFRFLEKNLKFEEVSRRLKLAVLLSGSNVIWAFLKNSSKTILTRRKFLNDNFDTKEIS